MDLWAQSMWGLCLTSQVWVWPNTTGAEGEWIRKNWISSAWLPDKINVTHWVTWVIFVSKVPQSVLAEMGSVRATDEIPKRVANPKSIKWPSAPESINVETRKAAPPTLTEARNSARPPDGSRVEVMLTMCSPLRGERDERPTTGHAAATCPASPQYRHSWLARRRRRSPRRQPCSSNLHGLLLREDEALEPCVTSGHRLRPHGALSGKSPFSVPRTESNTVVDPDGEVNQFIQAHWKLQGIDLVLHIFSQSVEEVIPERLLVPATGYGERAELNRVSGHGLFALLKHRQGSCRLNSPGRAIEDLAQLHRECLKRLVAGLLAIPHGCAPLPRLPHQERDDVHYPG